MATTEELLAELADAQPAAEVAAAVGGWFDRVLASSDDRRAWLLARQRVATATEVAELRLHSSNYRTEVVAAKLRDPKEITGNRYIDRGHEREPVIAAWIASQWPAVRGNGLLLCAAENSRHAATPDLLGSVDGELVCGDIKTSKHDLRPSRPDGYFWRTHYFGQLQWQMYVTGTRRALFVWERHDDAWPHPEPLEVEPEWEWVERDDAEIGRMVAAADAMLAALDQARAGETDEALPDDDVVDAEVVYEGPDGQEISREEFEALELRRRIEGLGLAVLAAREAEAEVKARKDAPWLELQTLLESSRSDAWESGLVKVTWTNEEAVESVPDRDAALAAPVEGLDADVTGSDLAADFDRARIAWEAHQARFRTERTISKRRLTVTAVKPSKGKK